MTGTTIGAPRATLNPTRVRRLGHVYGLSSLDPTDNPFTDSDRATLLLTNGLWLRSTLTTVLHA